MIGSKDGEIKRILERVEQDLGKASRSLITLNKKYEKDDQTQKILYEMSSQINTSIGLISRVISIDKRIKKLIEYEFGG